jgi:tetratricopeptide (TPR) repeat protein
MNSRFLLVSLSAALSLASLPVHAQRRGTRNNPSLGNNSPMSSATIRGVVRSAEQNVVLSMVRVELRTFGGEPVGVTYTNDDGVFTFANVQPNSYQIVINQDGYEPAQQSVDLSGHMVVGQQIFFLKELPGHSPSAAGGVVSAHELALPSKVKKDYKQGLSALYEKHKPEASLPFFARVIAQAPDFYQAYQHSGVAYQRLGRNQEAEASLRKAIELSEGRDGETQTALALVLVNLNRCSEAETFARQGLAASPGSWFAHYELARALIGLRRPDEAEKSIQETLGLNPNLPQAYLLLASVHMSRNDGLSFLKDLDNYLRLDPKGPQSDWARKTREQVQKGMAEAKAAGTPVAPHP